MYSCILASEEKQGDGINVQYVASDSVAHVQWYTYLLLVRKEDLCQGREPRPMGRAIPAVMYDVVVRILMCQHVVGGLSDYSNR